MTLVECYVAGEWEWVVEAVVLNWKLVEDRSVVMLSLQWVTTGDGEAVSLMTGDGSLTSGDGSLINGDVSSDITVWRGTAVLPPGVDFVDDVEVSNCCCSGGKSTGRGSGCLIACVARLCWKVGIGSTASALLSARSSSE